MLIVGDFHRLIGLAAELTRQRWSETRGGFNRKLVYEPWGWPSRGGELPLWLGFLSEVRGSNAHLARELFVSDSCPGRDVFIWSVQRSP